MLCFVFLSFVCEIYLIFAVIRIVHCIYILSLHVNCICGEKWKKKVKLIILKKKKTNRIVVQKNEISQQKMRKKKVAKNQIQKNKKK